MRRRTEHDHDHGHGLEGGWATWLSHPALLITVVALGVAAVATVAGLIRLWPDGAGQDAAIAEATELGLATERLGATVETVTDGPCSYSTDDDPQRCRNFTFVLDEGPDEGDLVTLPELNLATAASQVPDLGLGDTVILGYEPSTNFYFYADRDRVASLAWLTGLFAVVVIALGRLRGALALGAMAVTVAVLVGFVAPSVLDGNDPILVAVVAGSAIAFVSLYLTHGFNPTTTVALGGTLGALGLTLAISWLFFRLANFSGLATEEGFTLPLIADVNLASLLLGGAVLGALGALDDVTVTQVATVAELHRRNPDLSAGELVTSGIRVGREHIASTVNTLLLAYAGASMPLLLVFAASNQSLLTAANSELVAVEIVRTLCGSIGLVAAVPITTALVALLVATRAAPTAATALAGAGDGTGEHRLGHAGVQQAGAHLPTGAGQLDTPPLPASAGALQAGPPPAPAGAVLPGSPPAPAGAAQAGPPPAPAGAVLPGPPPLPAAAGTSQPPVQTGWSELDEAEPPELELHQLEPPSDDEPRRPRQPDWVEEALEPDWSEPEAIEPRRSRRRRRAEPDPVREQPEQPADWSEFAPHDDFEDL